MEGGAMVLWPAAVGEGDWSREYPRIWMVQWVLKFPG